MTNSFITLFSRDLNKLAEELDQYEEESTIWRVEPGINNSAGNLALHLIGNLNHFVGAVLGNSNYLRDRVAEFNDKDIPLSELKTSIYQTIEIVTKTLRNLSEERLIENYPMEVFKHPMTTQYFLMHLYGHLNYHLGQVNYHRRLLSI